MSVTYNATYSNESGQQCKAILFLSSVTLTIRCRNGNNEEEDIYWLAEQIQSMEQGPIDTKLFYPGSSGNMQRLVITDPELLEAIKKNFKGYRFIGGLYHHTIGKTRNKIFLLLAGILFLLAAAYLWLLPWIGERIAMNFSKQYEIKLGESMYNSTMNGYTVDSNKTVVINKFFKELKYKTGYPIKITVVQSREVNAFAIPGGNIVVHDAILEGMKTPEELAALLGHEASHIEKKHSLRNIFRSLARKMFLLLVVGNDAGIISFVAENADALKGLEYSRTLETEADNNSMRLMAESGLNSNGMMLLIQLLQKEAQGKEPAAFMSTHPVFKDRIENIRKEIRKYPAAGESSATIKKIFHDLYEEW